MNSIILYSRRAYSLEKHCQICTWHEHPYEIGIEFPRNCAVRIVDAELSGDLTSEFKELCLSWSQSNQIFDMVKDKLPIRHGLSDYCLYFPSMQLGIVLSDHRGLLKSHEVVCAASVEDMKQMFND